MAKVFISHKSSKLNNLMASGLKNYLEKKGHTVFLDIEELHGGMEWAKTIYDQISKCDVLIVMVTEDAASAWVQREVDYARGSRIEILPIVVNDTDLVRNADGVTTADKVMDRLAIDVRHFVRAISPEDPDYRYIQVENDVRKLVQTTRKSQKQWMDELKQIWDEQDEANECLNPPKVPQPQRASYFFLQNNQAVHPCKIYLAGGDITRISGIDVLVNSENVYMQMQRVFAKPVSVSSIIRLNGARWRGITIEEDVIQNELNLQIYGEKGYGTPVSVGDVFITSAGHENSDLKKHGFKYILHVAALDAKARKGETRLGDANDVRKCIQGCFAKLAEIPSPVKSIIFPMLGTGYGGLSVLKCAEATVDAVKEYLAQNPTSTLSEIYLCPYKLEEIEIVEDYMDKHLNRVTSPWMKRCLPDAANP